MFLVCLHMPDPAAVFCRSSGLGFIVMFVMLTAVWIDSWMLLRVSWRDLVAVSIGVYFDSLAIVGKA